MQHTDQPNWAALVEALISFLNVATWILVAIHHARIENNSKAIASLEDTRTTAENASKAAEKP